MGLLKSKKFIVSVFGVIAVVVGHFYAPGEEMILQLAGIVAAYVVGQGLADIGKSAAEINKG